MKIIDYLIFGFIFIYMIIILILSWNIDKFDEFTDFFDLINWFKEYINVKM